MEHLSIEGGKRLVGEVRIDGAKNAALPACVATLLTDEPVTLHNVPHLRDVNTILATIASLGKHVSSPTEGTVAITGEGPLNEEADAFYVEQMRASFLVLGPLVARLGRAVVPLPGGCTIGPRPVDLHLQGLRQLGATVEEREGSVAVRADRLRGAPIALPYPSVGATEQLVTTATLAKGETRIENPAREPEIADLIALLRKMGARIDVEPTAIHVIGSDRLHTAEHSIIPDRLEAGTYLLAAGMTEGEVTVCGVIPDHLSALLAVLRDAGMTVSKSPNAIAVSSHGRPRPVRVRTAPHPGFPTDLQPPLVACLSLAAGESVVEETVFESRFSYVPALNEMGARIEVVGGAARISGVGTLQGRSVSAPDIRAGAALVLAGLAAQGHTTIDRLDRIDRGYAHLEEKLIKLGARIERIQ